MHPGIAVKNLEREDGGGRGSTGSRSMTQYSYKVVEQDYDVLSTSPHLWADPLREVEKANIIEQG